MLGQQSARLPTCTRCGHPKKPEHSWGTMGRFCVCPLSEEDVRRVVREELQSAMEKLRNSS